MKGAPVKLTWTPKDDIHKRATTYTVSVEHLEAGPGQRRQVRSLWAGIAARAPAIRVRLSSGPDPSCEAAAQ